MTTQFAVERVKILIEESGLNDRELAERLNVNQSTAWRLRKGKIAKVNKYVSSLEKLASISRPPDDLDQLTEIARRSPALRGLLISLLHFMQESSQPAA